MKERRVLVKAFAGEYQKAGKKGKGEILNRFVAATGYHRRYAARLLGWHGRTIWIRPGVGLRVEVGRPVRRGRKRIYDEAVQEVLKRLWRMLDYLCGKRLQEALREVVPALERHGELRLQGEVREKLLRMGAATIDRLLAGEKKKLQLKSRSRTKPGTLLRQQIPVRTFADWDEVRPGFAEVDLVGHDGGSTRGDYVQTLNLTDVATAWAEAAAVRNRARVWVLEALEQLRKRLPFPLLGLDSDNGGEFINGHLLQYCIDEQLTFTRSRPWRKNDNCFIEQKNYSVVRRYVGYARYDSEAELHLLNRLYAQLRLYVNFFLPSQKLQEKIRRGSRVTKRYDRAQTPYQRVLASAHLPDALKQGLREQYDSLNLAQLYRNLCHLQEELLRLNARKTSARAVDGAGPDGQACGFPTGPWKPPAAVPTPSTTPATTHSPEGKI